MKTIDEIISQWQEIWRWENTNLNDNCRAEYETLIRAIDSLDDIDKDIPPFKQILKSEKPKRLRQTKINNWRVAQQCLVNASISKKEIVDTYNVLTWIVKKGQNEGCWNFSSDPGYAEYPKPESPSFSPDVFSYINQLVTIKSALNRVSNAHLKNDVLVGKLILHLVFHLNSLSVSLIFSIINSLKDLTIYSGQNHIWIDVNISWRGKDNQEFRRLYLTSGIISIIHEIHSRIINDSGFRNVFFAHVNNDIKARSRSAFLWRMVNLFLKDTHCKINKRINSFKKLIDIQHANLDTKISPFVTQYSRQGFVSHSLKPQCWSRLLSIESFDKKAIKIEYKTREPNDEDKIDNPLIKELYHCLNPRYSRRDAADNLISWLSENHKLASIWERLGQWFVSMLTSVSGYGSKSSVKTIRKIAYWIVPALVEYTGYDDITEYHLSNWIELYELVVQTKDSKSYRSQVANELYKFHIFMCKKYNVEEFSEKEINFKNTLVEVDANIISFDEYERCRNLIENESDPRISTSYKTILKLLLALGFHCGLRRREALYIKLSDTIGFSSITLYIRKNTIRGLKTTSSKRKLPLERLLPDRELAEFHHWLQDRRKEDVGKCIGFLFAIPSEGYSLFREDEVYKSLHTYLRAATGDETVRFHHLRHSFATWSALRFLAGDLTIGLFNRSHMPLTYKTMLEVNQWCYRIRKHDNNTRSDLYRIARLMGHSSPKVTLEHYIHCLDLVTYLYACKLIETKQQVVIQHNKPSSTLYNNFDKSSDLKTKYTINKYKNVIKRLNPINILIPGISLEIDNKSYFDRCWHALYQTIVFKRAANELIREVALTEDEIEQLKSLSIETFNKENSNSKIRRFKDKRTKKSYPFPALPSKEVDIRIAREIEQKINSLNDTEKNELIIIYFNHVKIQGEDLIFKEGKRLQHFLNLAKRIGITHNQLNIRLRPTNKQPKRKSIGYWRNEGKVPKSVKIKSNASADNRGEHGWLFVKLIFHKDGSSSPALRYTMTMTMLLLLIQKK